MIDKSIAPFTSERRRTDDDDVHQRRTRTHDNSWTSHGGASASGDAGTAGDDGPLPVRVQAPQQRGAATGAGGGSQGLPEHHQGVHVERDFGAWGSAVRHRVLDEAWTP